MHLVNQLINNDLNNLTILTRVKNNRNKSVFKSVPLRIVFETLEKQYNLTRKYYNKAVPLVYKDFLGISSYLKYLFANFLGLFRVMYRQLRSSDTRIVAHKSAALASQNFMISMAGFGYDTCPMEGFDSLKLKRLLELDKKSEINMVIGCGIRLKEGVYGERFRIPFDQVYFKR